MHKSVEAGRQSDSLATCLFMPHVPHATCCKRADTHIHTRQARLLDSCLTKCLVDFWKICTTRRQLAPWQAARLAAVACTPPLPPCTCPCPALSLKKCTKWRALSARQPRRASELIHFASGTRQSHICGRQTRLSSFSLHSTPPLPACPLLCGSGGTHNA